MRFLHRVTSATLLIAACTLSMDAPARTPRSAAEIAAFKRENPCPATQLRRGACPGYVIDHMWPLACGGEDHQRNMQWQTVAEAKAKDKWERKMCGKAD